MTADTALYPLRFEPIFRQYIWGGRRLETVLGKSLGPGEHYAESWEVVEHAQGQSRVANGPLRGKTLGEIRQLYPQALLGCHADEPRFPLIFKFLDAQENLSVQVHPDDAAAARLVPPDFGKTEAWVVVAAAPHSVIYAGLKPHCTAECLRRAIAEGHLLEYLHRFEPQPGDTVFIPAGVVHALGAGLMVAEIQQSSDTTFRLFDWNRLGPDGTPRPLHVEQALAVIDYAYGPVNPIRPKEPDSQGRESLVYCDKFCLDRWHLTRSASWGGDGRFHILSVIDGQVHAAGSYLDEVLPRGQTVLVPAASGITLTPTEPATVLDIYLPFRERHK